VDQSPRNNRDYVSEAIFFMTNHSSEAITAQDIANTIGLDVSYFSRIFKKKTGMRPIGWLNRYRLDQAQRLLSETDMKIKEIAEAVGFASVYYFSKCFKMSLGVTPKEYRKAPSRG
jgi:transcriptional regulator GlxA family with amidase domain